MCVKTTGDVSPCALAIAHQLVYVNCFHEPVIIAVVYSKNLRNLEILLLIDICLIFSTLVLAAMAENSELQLVQSNGQFTNKVYKILSDNDDNVLFSPINLHMVLSMSYFGSAGSTLQAYNTALGLPGLESTAEGYEKIINKLNGLPNVTLLTANKVYVMNGYKVQEKFKAAVVGKFKSEVDSVDFGQSAAAASAINSWVEEKTKQKIKNLIPSSALNSLTRLVLVSAIYFKGNWQHKFDKSNTKTEPFRTIANKTIDVQMMHLHKKLKYNHDEQLGAKILELPYTNPDVSMIIILPDETLGIKEVEAKLENTDLTKITEGMWNTDVELALPKFKIETEISFEEPLGKIGLGEIFDAGKANFSNLIESDEQLYVSKVIQKAFLEVNEEGAEAAAASAIGIHTLSAQKNEYFLADHPFIVYLKVRSTILFASRCVEPKSGDNDIAPRGSPLKDPFAHNIYISLED